MSDSPALSAAFPNAESGDAARFRSARDAFQFAAVELKRARRLFFLAELVGDSAAYSLYEVDVHFLEKAVAVTEREWTKAGQ